MNNKRKLINSKNFIGDTTRIWDDAKGTNGDVSNIRGEVAFLEGDIDTTNFERNVTKEELKRICEKNIDETDKSFDFQKDSFWKYKTEKEN